MIIKDVFRIIEKRLAEGDPEKSYVAKLKKDGIEKILKKINEETTELIVSSISGGKEKITYEAVDLIFHTLVLLAYKEIGFDEIEKEFEKRFGISGLEEKKQRNQIKGEK